MYAWHAINLNSHVIPHTHTPHRSFIACVFFPSHSILSSRTITPSHLTTLHSHLHLPSPPHSITPHICLHITIPSPPHTSPSYSITPSHHHPSTSRPPPHTSHTHHPSQIIIRVLLCIRNFYKIYRIHKKLQWLLSYTPSPLHPFTPSSLHPSHSHHRSYKSLLAT